MAFRVEGAAHLGPGRAREHQWTAPGRALDKVRAQFRLTLARNLRGRPIFIKFLYREENCTRKDHTTFPVTRSLLTRGADPDTLGWIDPCGEGSVNRCLYLPCKRIKPQRLKRPRTFLYSNWTLISLTAAGKRSAFSSPARPSARWCSPSYPHLEVATTCQGTAPSAFPVALGTSRAFPGFPAGLRLVSGASSLSASSPPPFLPLPESLISDQHRMCMIPSSPHFMH